jgi:ABC-type glycerol-3-phosphate transport system substrate-binding protein
MTRRSALAALAAGGAGFALWPHRPRRRGAIQRGRAVVTYWEKWTGEEGAAMQAVVDRFNAAQDRIWVERVAVSDIVPKAMVAIGGGDPPDLVGLYSFNVPLFAESGALTPLPAFGWGTTDADRDAVADADTVADADALDPASYAPAVRRLLTHEGHQWAGVTTCHTMALYCNVAMLRLAGLAAPRTVDELDAAADALTRLGAEGRIERAGFLPNVPKWWPYAWPAMFGGALYDAAADRATLLAPENLAAYEWISARAARHGRAATTAFAAGFGRAHNSALDPFLTERVAMIVQGPWLARLAQRHAPQLEYACVPMPMPRGRADGSAPAGMLEADVLAIPRGARRTEEAFEFLAYVQRQEVLEELAAAHCKPSPLREVSAGFRRAHPNPHVGVFESVAKSPAVMTAPPTRVWPQYADLIGAAFDRIWAGAEVAAELRSVQARAQELLDRARSLRARRARAPQDGSR